MKKLLTLTILFFLGCTQSRPTPENLEPEIVLKANQEIDKWIEWTKKTVSAISTEYSLPKLGKIEIVVVDPSWMVLYDPDTQTTSEVIFYICGLYHRDTLQIEVWIREPSGAMITFSKFQDIVLHELMHHYYYENGMTYPEDHNKLFEQEIIKLCWHEYKDKFK